MNLYFKRHDKSLRLVAKNISDPKVHRAMMDYIYKIDPNYRVYYVRNWTTEDGVTYYDFGSHSQCFILCDEAMAIATYMVEYGADNTTYGSWRFDFEELNEIFEVDLHNDSELLDDIDHDLYFYHGEKLSEIEVTDDDFCLTFYGKYITSPDFEGYDEY